MLMGCSERRAFIWGTLRWGQTKSLEGEYCSGRRVLLWKESAALKGELSSRGLHGGGRPNLWKVTSPSGTGTYDARVLGQTGKRQENGNNDEQNSEMDKYTSFSPHTQTQNHQNCYSLRKRKGIVEYKSSERHACYVVGCNILVVGNSKINSMNNVNRKQRKNTNDEGSDVS
ncbi:1812_t:CDS:2, partial [Paraglomus brasilianum]